MTGWITAVRTNHVVTDIFKERRKEGRHVGRMHVRESKLGLSLSDVGQAFSLVKGGWGGGVWAGETQPGAACPRLVGPQPGMALRSSPG